MLKRSEQNQSNSAEYRNSRENKLLLLEKKLTPYRKELVEIHNKDTVKDGFCLMKKMKTDWKDRTR